jgi:hypothetical protein
LFLYRELNKKTLGKEGFAESQIRNSRQRTKTLGKDFFAKSQFFWLSAKKF